MELNIYSILFILCFIKISLSAPVTNKNRKDVNDKLKDMNLEYQTYLQQVAKILENDPEFVNRMKKYVNESKPADIAQQLEFVKHNVRSQLDELKRIELDRLRKYAIAQMERNELGIDRKNIKIPRHLDLSNPNTFEVEDLKKLISTTNEDMAEISRKRKEDFKNYEIEKELGYREKLNQLNETERLEKIKEHEEMIKKHKDHPKVHHPGSKPQLEQVWEEEDHLPKEEFNPDVFFSMHDLNGDNFLDMQEVEAIVALEVKKMYDVNNEEDDPVERMEEFARMTEHIFNEADADNDGLISKQEFIDMTKRSDFEEDEGWKGLEEELPYTDEELKEYENMVKRRKKEILEN